VARDSPWYEAARRPTALPGPGALSQLPAWLLMVMFLARLGPLHRRLRRYRRCWLLPGWTSDHETTALPSGAAVCIARPGGRACARPPPRRKRTLNPAWPARLLCVARERPPLATTLEWHTHTHPSTHTPQPRHTFPCMHRSGRPLRISTSTRTVVAACLVACVSSLSHGQSEGGSDWQPKRLTTCELHPAIEAR
jgi:hypothetical protein